MRIRRCFHWLSKPRFGRLKIVLLGLFTILLSFLHLVVLPSVTGGYNEECLTPDWKRQILRAMVQNISRAFDEFNVKYWIDYGTLLGAYRINDILPYDHDADISLLFSSNPYRAFVALEKNGIHANGLQARYGDVSIDFIRWKAKNTTRGAKKEVTLHKYYPPFVKDNFIVRNHHKLESIPLSWIAPTGKINFHGVNVAIPNDPEKVLAFRYPWTYGKMQLEFPYKWKCWVPCWLRKSSGC